MHTHISQDTVSHVAKLAQLPLSEQAATAFTQAFEETLSVVDNLKSVDTAETEPTHQVTGLENVWREDEVNEEHMFSQEEALANAPNQHQGYFLVKRILNHE